MKDRGAALPAVLAILLIFMATGAVFFLVRTTQDLKHSSSFRRLKAASALANNALVDLLRQFSQSYQEDHYDPQNLNRNINLYSVGFSSISMSPNKNQHFISFTLEGGYGKKEAPLVKKTIRGVIKFISDLTTFGTMWNGNFTTSASNATYVGKVWVNGTWNITGANVVVQGGPVFVKNNITGNLTINGDLYRGGTKAPGIVVNGADNAYYPQMTWPTIDQTYFQAHYNVKITANNTQVVFSTGAANTVAIGTAAYTVPSDGMIIYGENVNLNVRGTLGGRVTVAALRISGAVGGQITMNGDLFYADGSSQASSSNSFGAIASQGIIFSKNGTGATLSLRGVYFVDSAGTTGMSAAGTGTGKTLAIFGTRNKGISLGGGFSTASITYDGQLDTYPPPGLPEKPNLVTYHIR